MIISLFDRNIAGILLLFSISPGSKYYRNEIKEKTGMNNVPLDNTLAELLALDVLKLDGRLYSLNVDYNLVMQIIEDSKKGLGGLPLKVQIEIVDFISDISKVGGVSKIILFGSYAKLIYSDKSDIDIALVIGDVRNKIKVEKKVEEIALRISDKYGKEIQIHFFSEGDLKHKKDPLIKDILKNGRGLV